MLADEDFFVTSMPSSRPADYYLGYLEGSVFIDFNNIDEKRVCLKRISFDGYGCCELTPDAIPLNEEDSHIFKDIVQGEVIDQKVLSNLIKKAIALNKRLIWKDALEEYELI